MDSRNKGMGLPKPFVEPTTASARLIRLFHSIGFRILAFYALIFTSSFLVLFAVVYWIATDALVNEAEDEVMEEVGAVVSEYRSSGALEAIRDIRSELDAPRGLKRYYVLVRADGQLVASNMSIMPAFSGWKIFPHIPGLILPDNEERDEHVLVAHGSKFADGGFLVIGYDLYFVREIQEAIGTAFLWSAGVMLLLAFAGGYFFSIRLMRRIEQFNFTMQSIGQGKMETRVLARGTGDELDILAGGINRMLDRIQHLLESLKQVTTDIAHDLRTPLSQLHQRLEAAKHDIKSPAKYEETIERAKSSIDDILATFEALLRIAQIEAGMHRSSFGRVNLTSVCEAISEAYRAVIEDRRQIFSVRIAKNVDVDGDRDLLTQLVANLIENAIKHSPEGADILLDLKHEGSVVRLIIADSGPGIPENEWQNVFRRFYRLEQSRTTAGSGLGMALVKAVCDLHGAEIILSDNLPGLRAEVRFAQKP